MVAHLILVAMKIKLGFVPSHRAGFNEEISAQMRDRVIRALSKIRNLEVYFPSEKDTRLGLVRNDEDAEKTISIFKHANVDGLIIGAMNFGDEVSAIKVAASINKPVLLFAVKEEPLKTKWVRRDSFCGTLSISSGLYRRGIRFMFAGVVLPEEQSFLRAVEVFIRACNAVRGFRGARIGLIGPRPERFETCSFNERILAGKFNLTLIPVSQAILFHMANNLKDDDSKVAEIMRDMKDSIRSTDLEERDLLKMAKLEMALRLLAKEKRLSAMAIHCWPASSLVYGVMPCFVMGRIVDSGIMCSCEGDVYGALAMLFQYLLSMGEKVPHFIDWTIKHPERDDAFLAWHCGNAPPSLACEECEIKVSSGGLGSFRIRSGDVTICSLSEHNGEFKMLITRGRVIDDDYWISGTGAWVEVPNLDEVYRCLVENGFVHHASMIHGDYVDAAVNACKFLGITPMAI